MPAASVLTLSQTLPDAISRHVLLRGATEPAKRRTTADGRRVTFGDPSLRGVVFFCAVGGLPLFAYDDLSHVTCLLYPPTRCPLLTLCMPRMVCTYAMPNTDMAYGASDARATRCP
eukprot:3559006-Rhodomonas_salina.1